MLKRIDWTRTGAAERERLFTRPSLASDAFDVARGVLGDVRKRGEAAVRDYAQRFDQWAPEGGFRVPADELAAAEAALAPEDRQAILDAADAVRRFHAAQGYRDVDVETWPGARAQRRATPIDVAGLYVPAGTAPLVSTLIMLAVPAQIAGVPRIVVIAPPRKGEGIEPTVLAAARLLALDEVYAIGGAHGIAALGYGAAGLPRADKIFGPGNAYVAAAKALLAQSGGAATDLPAGPSEVMVVADDEADPELVAIDLLSQAEHDTLAQVVLVAFSEAFADRVEAETERLLAQLPRAGTARAALSNSRAVIVEDEAQALEACDAYASEHLIVQTGAPRAFAEKVRHAGSIFLGPWTPEAAGDYAAGPNHALPTAGAARAYGGVTVEMFQKTTTLLELTQAGAGAIAGTVERLAALEGLDAHRLAMAMRRKKAEGS
ncbi:MAG: histidinol dehydrogenase [Oceanicaulis sp.]